MRHAIHILTVSTLDSSQEKMRSAAQTERLQEPAGHVLAREQRASRAFNRDSFPRTPRTEFSREGFEPHPGQQAAADCNSWHGKRQHDQKCHSQTHQAPKNAARAGSSGATLITTTRTMSAAIKCQTPGRLQKRECRNHDRYCIRQRGKVPVPNWLACLMQFPNWLLACLSSAVCVQCSFFRSDRYRKRLFPDWPFSPPQKNRRPRILRGQVACRNAVAFAV